MVQIVEERIYRHLEVFISISAIWLYDEHLITLA